MDNWKCVTLGDIAKYSNSRTSFDKLTIENYISTENMLPEKAGKINASSLPIGNAIKYMPNQILISNIRPYFKKIWYATTEGGCSADVLVFNISTKIDSKYFYYFLSQDCFFNYVMGGSKGTKMPRGDKQQILLFPFKYPDKTEQKVIADTLSCLDDKIELNNRINKNLEEIAQAIFKNWFVDFEPFQDGEFEDSELGRIPKGWRVVELSKVLLFNKRGYSPSYNNEGIPVVNQRCIRNHTINQEAIQYHDNNIKEAPADLFLMPFDVLINSMGVGTLGRVAQAAIIEDKKIVHSCITILRANRGKIEPIILGYYIKSIEKIIEDMGTGSTGQTSLNNRNFGMMKMILPPLPIQKEISLQLEKLLFCIDRLNIESATLTRIREILLPKLMSGEIRVPIEEAQ